VLPTVGWPEGVGVGCDGVGCDGVGWEDVGWEDVFEGWPGVVTGADVGCGEVLAAGVESGLGSAALLSPLVPNRTSRPATIATTAATATKDERTWPLSSVERGNLDLDT
jgi:hypothetical protein